MNHNVGTAFLNGLFLSISATTNAGFDITGMSMIPYKTDYFVQIVIMILLDSRCYWFSRTN